MIVEREELMASPKPGGKLSVKKAHYLKTIYNPTITTNDPPNKPPLHSLSSEPCTHWMIKKRVVFKGRIKPQENWKSWVDNMEQTHQRIWKQVGIFDAIRASTYVIERHDELVIALAEKWCVETNTFVFSWGEATVSLEDVMILGGFSALGDCVRNAGDIMEDEELEKVLLDVFGELKGSCGNFRVTHYQWMEKFMGVGGEVEHVALLVLWLSRFVFSTNCYAMISPDVFQIAICLAGGIGIALAPAVLAAIYRDLRLLKENVVNYLKGEDSNCGSKLVLWSPLQIVQAWIWERFSVLAPKPGLLYSGEPRLARWQNLKGLEVASWRVQRIDHYGDGFLWRPYVLSLDGWELPRFYDDSEMDMLINSEVDDEVLSFARCLRPCELVGLDCVEQYLPHRVGIQFGLDQDIPEHFCRVNHDLQLAWNSYDKSLDQLRLYLPSRFSDGHVAMRYYKWWRGVSSFCREGRSFHGKPMRRVKRLTKKLPQVVDQSNIGINDENPDCSTVVHHSNEPKAEGTAASDSPAVNLASRVSYDGHNKASQNDQNTPSCEGLVDQSRGCGVNESTLERMICSGTSQPGCSKKGLLMGNTNMPVKREVGIEELVTEEKRTKAVEDQYTDRETNALDDVVIIDDDEDGNDDFNPVEAFLQDLESRISGLEITVSNFLTAKCDSGDIKVELT